MAAGVPAAGSGLPTHALDINVLSETGRAVYRKAARVKKVASEAEMEVSR